MPLQLDADHPEAYLWEGVGVTWLLEASNPPQNRKIGVFLLGAVWRCVASLTNLSYP